MNDILSKLLARKLSGEATKEEILMLEQLLLDNENHQTLHNTLQSYWKPNSALINDNIEDAHFHFVLDQAFADEKEELLSQDVNEKEVFFEASVKLFSYKRIAYAASIVALLGIGSWLFLLQSTKNSLLASKKFVNELLIKPGKKMRLSLPDGTQIWLNSNTKINYNKEFNEKTREVILDGEAFFDVAKDKSRPFIIHTKAMDIKVLGTAFNVKAYDGDKTTEASLVHGSIEASFVDRPNEKIILKPHEKIVFANTAAVPSDSKKLLQNISIVKTNEPIITVKKINYEVEKKDSVMVETVWMKNTLAFRSETLQDVATKIERWYDMSITIKNEKLKSKIFTGTFTNESITEVMNALCKSGNINYKKNKNNVIIF